MGPMFLKLLFSFAVLFTVAIIKGVYGDCTYQSPYDIIRLSAVRPESYKIAFTVKNDSLIKGESNITILVYYKTKRIVLHTSTLAVSRATLKLTNSSNQTSNKTYSIESQTYCHYEQGLELILKDEIGPGIYNLHINFCFPIYEKSLFLNNKYLWSPTVSNDLISARRVFPCWDNPGAKAKFEISVKHPVYYTALSNMPVSRTVDEEDGMITTYFDKTHRITPREVGIAIFRHLNQKSSPTAVRATLWYRQGMDKYLEHTFAAIEACKKAFDKYIVAYEMTPKMDHIIVSNLSVKIKGYYGLVFYREEDFIYSIDSDYPGRRSNILNLLGQETARHWFGRATSPHFWSDIWFSETFASFLNYILAEKLQNKAIQDLYAVQMVQSAFHQDLTLNIKPVFHEIDFRDRFEKDFYFSMCSNKGAALIRMLYYLFPAEEFRLAIRTYFTGVDNASFEPNNLWRYLQRHIDAAKKGWPDKVQEIMNSWLTVERYPEVYVNHTFNDNTATLSANCISNYTIIPITYITQSSLIYGNTWNITWYECWKTETKISEIFKHDFIIVNLEQSGYYRVNYNNENWEKITNYLTRENDILISVVNRAQLIDDAFYFMMKGTLKPSIFYNLIFYLSRETNYTVWYPMFNIISRTSTYLQLPEAKSPKTFFKTLLENLLEKIGYEESSDEDDLMRSLRLLAVRWACKLDGVRCKIAAKNKLIEHVELEPHKPILPWWKEWIYCTGMEKAYWDTWQAWMNKCIKEKNQTCLTYLACVRNEDILKNYFKMLLGTIQMDKFMKEVGTLTLFHTLFKKQANNVFMLEIFVKNLDEIKDKIYRGHDISPIQLLREVIGTVYNKNSLNMITTYAKGLKFMNETLERQFDDLMQYRYNELSAISVQFHYLQ